MKKPHILSIVTLLSLGCLAWAQAPSDKQEAEWKSLLGDVDVGRNAVAGRWQKSAAGLHVEAANGARLVLPARPRGEYDVRITFTRETGVHSIALFFPHGSGQASFEVDAWGEHLAGIQNIAGRSIRQNPTRRPNMTLTNGRRYTMTVEVRADQVRALLDDRVVATHRTDGRDLTVPDLWAMPDRQSLGIGAWDSATTFHAVEIRPAGGGRLALGRTETRVPRETPMPRPAATTPTEPRPAAGGKRVLIVIANRDFFYREYGDPRAELERAGIRVTVAAGRKAPCTPHGGSGQGPDGGTVQPDLALADVRAADYDAILFSGGWGASSYQYAFPGRYNDPNYNGDRNTKTVVNRLIGEFLAQDKYVCALCNGVTVLAWARVEGRSPLYGKRVCAPVRQAAAGIYNGRQAQPSCRWHPEVNGAVLSPAGAIGRPDTAADDVVVDGQIVTGEDDISAREMGRRLAHLLSR